MPLDSSIISNQKDYQMDSMAETQAKRLAIQQAQQQQIDNQYKMKRQQQVDGQSQNDYEYKLRKQQESDDEESALKDAFHSSIETGQDGQPRLNEKAIILKLYEKYPQMAIKLGEQFQTRDIANGKLQRENKHGDLVDTKTQLEIDSLRNPTPKPPDTRVIRMGNEQVTQQFNPKTQQYEEIGRGGAFAQSDPSSGAPVSVMGPDGKPIYVTKEKAIGMMPYDKSNENTLTAPDGMQYSTKPLPATSLKLQNDSLEKLSIANNNNLQLAKITKQIDDKKLSLGPLVNTESRIRNFIGGSNEVSRNFGSFKATLEKIRNDSLRLNAGVQTDGDAQRAWNELFDNVNDQKFVKQRLLEIQQINTRGAELHKMQVENIRGNYNAPPIDFSRYDATTGDTPPTAPNATPKQKQPLSAADGFALKWAKEHPNTPQAKQILKIHGMSK